jgi:hypothetical protein
MMVQSAAKTVAQYLKELPPERRKVIAAVRKLVNANLPAGYEEGMQYGMIGWYIPLSRYPETYNKQPLGYAALAAQKNYTTLYLMNVYSGTKAEKRLRTAYKSAGKKLDLGKCCLRFKSLEDLVPDAVAEAIASLTPEEFIESYEAARQQAKKGK